MALELLGPSALEPIGLGLHGLGPVTLVHGPMAWGKRCMDLWAMRSELFDVGSLVSFYMSCRAYSAYCTHRADRAAKWLANLFRA